MARNQEIPIYDFSIDDNADDVRGTRADRGTHAVLYGYDPDAQSVIVPIDHLQINSRTDRVVQFQGRSLGRTVMGFYSPRFHVGEIDISQNNAAIRETAEKSAEETPETPDPDQESLF